MARNGLNDETFANLPKSAQAYIEGLENLLKIREKEYIALEGQMAQEGASDTLLHVGLMETKNLRQGAHIRFLLSEDTGDWIDVYVMKTSKNGVKVLNIAANHNLQIHPRAANLVFATSGREPF